MATHCTHKQPKSPCVRTKKTACSINGSFQKGIRQRISVIHKVFPCQPTHTLYVRVRCTGKDWIDLLEHVPLITDAQKVAAEPVSQWLHWSDTTFCHSWKASCIRRVLQRDFSLALPSRHASPSGGAAAKSFVWSPRLHQWHTGAYCTAARLRSCAPLWTRCAI